MSPEPSFRQSRRSTRVPLKVLIEVRDVAERLTGETIIVNLHGALITTSTGLNTGMKISVYVYLTDKRASAQVVYLDPENPMRCGIELDNPQNIWGVHLPRTTGRKAGTEGVIERNSICGNDREAMKDKERQAVVSESRQLMECSSLAALKEYRLWRVAHSATSKGR